jgi:hypothetical protein
MGGFTPPPPSPSPPPPQQHPIPELPQPQEPDDDDELMLGDNPYDQRPQGPPAGRPAENVQGNPFMHILLPGGRHLEVIDDAIPPPREQEPPRAVDGQRRQVARRGGLQAQRGLVSFAPVNLGCTRAENTYSKN